ncbi:MAG: class I SAM-dependent methyltransferase, partial [Sedimentisphaerales bacterium]|nr:class I SAM-dependent methyltransferase [Sedimentisphaerales bacterium]
MRANKAKDQAEPDPVDSVPSTVYDERYYWEQNGPGGWRRFLELGANGEVGEGGYLLQLAQIPLGGWVLDIGCGRGEAILRCVQTDRVTGIGIDYSEAAVSIAQKIVYSFAQEDQKRRMLFVRADAQHLPFADHWFDVILSHHVIEHLYPAQLKRMLDECHRVLTKEGRLVLETGPNLWRLRYGFPITRLAYRLPGLGEIYRRMMGVKEIPQVARTEDDALYHAGEQSVFSLRRSLQQAGFVGRVWIGLDQSGHF